MKKIYQCDKIALSMSISIDGKNKTITFKGGTYGGGMSVFARYTTEDEKEMSAIEATGRFKSGRITIFGVFGEPAPVEDVPTVQSAPNSKVIPFNPVVPEGGNTGTGNGPEDETETTGTGQAPAEGSMVTSSAAPTEEVIVPVTEETAPVLDETTPVTSIEGGSQTTDTGSDNVGDAGNAPEGSEDVTETSNASAPEGGNDGNKAIEYPDITTFQRAKSILIAQHNVVFEGHANTEAVRKAASELNISFPNWK